MSLIDRDALAQAIRLGRDPKHAHRYMPWDSVPEWQKRTFRQDADAAIAYLRTVITAWNLAEVHPYGRSMDSIDFFKPYIRAIFGDDDEAKP